MAASGSASAQPVSQKVALYANVGADLTHYDLDIAGAELIKRDTIALPAGVQYAWPHASRRYLYVATAAVLQVLARPAQSITSPRYASIWRAAV